MSGRPVDLRRVRRALNELDRIAAEHPEIIGSKGQWSESAVQSIMKTPPKAARERVADHPTDIWLFQSTGNRAKSAGKPISRETVARKFKEIGEILGINLGTHSMRKSRGAAMYRDGVPIETICKVLNHSSPTVTMRYIGLDRATVAKTYDDYVL